MRRERPASFTSISGDSAAGEIPQRTPPSHAMEWKLAVPGGRSSHRPDSEPGVCRNTRRRAGHSSPRSGKPTVEALRRTPSFLGQVGTRASARLTRGCGLSPQNRGESSLQFCRRNLPTAIPGTVTRDRLSAVLARSAGAIGRFPRTMLSLCGLSAPDPGCGDRFRPTGDRPRRDTALRRGETQGVVR